MDVRIHVLPLNATEATKENEGDDNEVNTFIQYRSGCKL